MNLSLTSDFAGSTGEPAFSLKALAEAGFTNVMWCHHWCDDFLYDRNEIGYLKSLFKEYGIALSDIHGSQGVEKCWHSPVEYCRKAGVELVANRIEMLREMDGDGTIMMHVPFFNAGGQDEAERKVVKDHFDALCRSLDELMPLLEKADTAISAENMWLDSWELMEELLARYPANRLGICYDSGHGNANANKQLDHLERNKGRLIALHLDDNDGTGDQHQPPYYATVDWDRLAGIIATSSYKRELSFELSMMNTPFRVEGLTAFQQPYEARLAFAKDAHSRCVRFAEDVGMGNGE
jgi:sugar phosphate isomerase/epimerase